MPHYSVLMRFSSHKMHQIQNFPGLHRGDYSTPPDLLPGGEGLATPFLSTSPLLPALKASSISCSTYPHFSHGAVYEIHLYNENPPTILYHFIQFSRSLSCWYGEKVTTGHRMVAMYKPRNCILTININYLPTYLVLA